uniref:Uncharacterized protein n=1 Tax=Plectus sambesii TaxID=2011161 RepID=A0A914XIE1_9BILA
MARLPDAMEKKPAAAMIQTTATHPRTLFKAKKVAVNLFKINLIKEKSLTAKERSTALRTRHVAIVQQKMATINLNVPADIEGDDDDFEVVSPPPELSDSHFSASITPERNDGEATEDDAEMAARMLSAAAERSTESDANSSVPAVDPLAAFELIRREHSLAKAALMEQQSLLSNSFAVLRTQSDTKQKEIDELRARIADLELEAKTVASERDHLKKEVDSLLGYRYQVDELTAKMCEQEDVINYQERMINQCKTDGFVSVQPPMLTDHLLAKELRDKDTVIKKLHESLDNLEEKHAQEKERADNAEAILNVLKDESRDCEKTMVEMRNMYQQEVDVLRRQLSGIESTLQPFVTLTPSRDPDDEADVYTCERCQLRVTHRSLYDQHIIHCNPSSVTPEEVD